MRIVSFVAFAFMVMAVAWLELVQGQCGGGPNPEMKKVMTPMKDVTVAIVEAGQKLGEKKPDAKEAEVFKTNARRLGAMNQRIFTMVKSDPPCATECKKLNKGVGDLIKCAQKKDSNGIADGISQIRATCGSCKTCPGL
jgi:hypothetical protein